MHQPEEVKAFKHDLASYPLKTKKANEYREMIEDLYGQLGGVRAIDVSRVRTNSPPNKDVEYAIRDRISECERKLGLLEAQLTSVREVLDRIETPLKTAVIDVYARGKTIRSVALKMFISETGLRKRMNKAIEKALN